VSDPIFKVNRGAIPDFVVGDSVELFQVSQTSTTVAVWFVVESIDSDIVTGFARFTPLERRVFHRNKVFRVA
jgi:hypothetical protein